RVSSPLRATTPHYAREASVVENQLKVARMSCGGGGDGGGGKGEGGPRYGGPHGFECGEDNALGPEQTVTLHPGDVLYFPSGMWHTVETVEDGVSLNVSLMGTTYAEVACEAIRHLMYSRGDGGWREVVTSNGPGGPAVDRLAGLLGGLAGLVDGFVRDGGGAASVLPPALCHVPMEQYSSDRGEDDEDGDGEDGDDGRADEGASGNSDGGEEEASSSNSAALPPRSTRRFPGSSSTSTASWDRRPGPLVGRDVRFERELRRQRDVRQQPPSDTGNVGREDEGFRGRVHRARYRGRQGRLVEVGGAVRVDPGVLVLLRLLFLDVRDVAPLGKDSM
ncbi:hypothetical protein THAOC_32612, partial [Thalassiosira oceanica]